MCVCVYIHVCVCGLVTQSCLILCDPTEPARLLCPWNSPGKNTGVDCNFLLLHTHTHTHTQNQITESNAI